MSRFHGGWIKSWRSAWDSDLSQTPYLWALWNALLHMAVWRETTIIWEGHQRVLPPGSVVMGVRELASRWRCSQSVIKKYLRYLKTTNRIELETCPRGTLITICNWKLYQNDPETSCLQNNSSEATSELQDACSEGLIEEVKKEEVCAVAKRNPPAVGAIAEFSDSPALQSALQDVRAKVQQAWLDAYPDVVWIKGELLKARAWIEANPKKAPKSFGRFVTNWLAKGWEYHRKTVPCSQSINLKPLQLEIT
jgi:DNA-binding transcriptional regulator YhcF (GntR family)